MKKFCVLILSLALILCSNLLQAETIAVFLDKCDKSPSSCVEELRNYREALVQQGNPGAIEPDARPMTYPTRYQKVSFADFRVGVCPIYRSEEEVHHWPKYLRHYLKFKPELGEMPKYQFIFEALGEKYNCPKIEELAYRLLNEESSTSRLELLNASPNPLKEIPLIMAILYEECKVNSVCAPRSSMVFQELLAYLVYNGADQQLIASLADKYALQLSVPLQNVDTAAGPEDLDASAKQYWGFDNDRLIKR